MKLLIDMNLSITKTCRFLNFILYSAIMLAFFLFG
jgi:hypothetical protein